MNTLKTSVAAIGQDKIVFVALLFRNPLATSLSLNTLKLSGLRTLPYDMRRSQFNEVRRTVIMDKL